MKKRESAKHNLEATENGCCTIEKVSTQSNDPCREQPSDGTSCCDKTESKEVNSEKTACC